MHTYVSIPSGRIHKEFQTVVASEERGWGLPLHVLLCLLNFELL